MILKYVLAWFTQLSPMKQRETLRAVLMAAGCSRSQARAIVATLHKEQS